MGRFFYRQLDNRLGLLLLLAAAASIGVARAQGLQVTDNNNANNNGGTATFSPTSAPVIVDYWPLDSYQTEAPLAQEEDEKTTSNTQDDEDQPELQDESATTEDGEVDEDSSNTAPEVEDQAPVDTPEPLVADDAMLYIIIGAAVFGGLSVLFVLYACWKCNRRRKATARSSTERNNNNANKSNKKAAAATFAPATGEYTETDCTMDESDGRDKRKIVREHQAEKAAADLEAGHSTQSDDDTEYAEPNTTTNNVDKYSSTQQGHVSTAARSTRSSCTTTGFATNKNNNPNICPTLQCPKLLTVASPRQVVDDSKKQQQHQQEPNETPDEEDSFIVRELKQAAAVLAGRHTEL